TLERRDNGRCVLSRDFDVKRILRIGLNQRAFTAKFHAADAANFNLVMQAGFGHSLVELFFDALGIRGHATGGHATAQGDLLLRRQFLFFDLDEIVENHFATHFLICSRADSGVCLGVTVPSYTTAGAIPQAPMHRAVSRETLLSSVVSP